jgi:hypothetical protein
VSEQTAWTVPERQRYVVAGRPARYTYHLMAGDWDTDATFQPVRCGGGIVFPYREKVAKSQVCPDCLAGRVTLTD